MATSSADPQALEAYLRASASMADAVRARVSHLLSDYDDVVPRLQWGTFDASATLADLETWSRANDNDDEWLAAVDRAFTCADTGPLDDTTLDEAVTSAGVAGRRIDLRVDDACSTLGAVTSGFRDDDRLLTTGGLRDWEREAARGAGDHLLGGAHQLVTEPVAWVGDHGDDLLAGAAVVGGVALIATGVGAPVGAGLLAGAALSTAGQVGLTGHLDGRQVWADAAVGGLTGGVGAGVASVTSRLGLTGARAAGTRALLDGGAAGAASPVHQYLTTGRVDLTDAGLSALVATIPGATSYWLARPGPSGPVWIRRSVDGLDDAPKVWTTTGRIKAARLPTRGKIRFVPGRPRSGAALRRNARGHYIDQYDNVWKPGPSRTPGEPFEWDVQLSPKGKASIGHLSRDGRHVNVSLQGRVTH